MCTVLRPRPHYTVFKRKRYCFVPDTATVHNTPFSNENDTVLFRIRLPSTIHRFQTKTILFCSGYGYRPHYTVFKRKRYCFVPDTATVHITPFSNENDTVLFRIRLPSTLHRFQTKTILFCSGYGYRPHYTVFKRKRYCFVPDTATVHITPFSNENDTVLFRIRLPSTLHRFQTKTILFCSGYGYRPHYTVFKRKRYCFVPDTATVHNTPFSNENDTVLFRIRLPSTIHRFQTKTILFCSGYGYRPHYTVFKRKRYCFVPDTATVHNTPFSNENDTVLFRIRLPSTIHRFQTKTILFCSGYGYRPHYTVFKRKRYCFVPDTATVHITPSSNENDTVLFRIRLPSTLHRFQTKTILFCSGYGYRPHYTVFKRKRYCFVPDTATVHNTPFSNENDTVLFRIRLPSTLHRFQTKTILFCSGYGYRPQYTVFKRKRYCFVPDTATVHNTPFSNENDTVLFRIRLPSTLHRFQTKTILFCSGYGYRPHYTVFKRKRYCFVPDTATVHITPFSNENDTVLFRIRLPSTLHRFQTKTILFCSGYGYRPHYTVFKRKRYCFVPDTATVHITPFSNENDTVLFRIRLPSTLHRFQTKTILFCSGYGYRPQYTVFKRKRYCFVPDTATVHNTPFSNENDTVLFRIRLPSTLHRFQTKTILFCSGYGYRPQYTVFKRKRYCFVPDTATVHNTPFSNENDTVLFRIRLPSTLHRFQTKTILFCSGYGYRPHYTVFKRKRYCFVPDTATVHITPFSNENDTVLFRIRLPSTLHRFQTKTILFCSGYGYRPHYTVFKRKRYCFVPDTATVHITPFSNENDTVLFRIRLPSTLHRFQTKTILFCSGYGYRPHYTVFKRKRYCFVPDTVTVHTTTLKTISENGSIRKRSPEWNDLKTILFENAVFLV